MMEGVRRSQYDSLVKSVFHRSQFASDDLVEVIEKKFQSREWKKGVLRTLRGTVGHSIAELLEQIPHPSLVIWGENDRVISDVPGSIRAAERILKVRQVVIPKCGHAPQIEKSHLVNTLVTRFFKGKLQAIPPQLDPGRFLEKERKRRPPGGRRGHDRRPAPSPREPDERRDPLPQEIPPPRDEDRQPRAEQPVALAGDRLECRLGQGQRHRRAGRRHRPDHESSRRAGPARDPGRRPRTRPRLLRHPPRSFRIASELRCDRRRRPRPDSDAPRPRR